MKYDDIIHKIDTKKGIFLLNGEIDNHAAYKIIKEILDYSQKFPNNKIVIYICSTSGSVTNGMAIYDVMRYIPNTISTIAIEKVAGIAALILAAGTPGMRYAYSDAEIMFEGFWVSKREKETSNPDLDTEPRNGSWGNKKTEDIPREIYEAIEKICKILAQATGKNIAEIENLVIEKQILNANDALQWGLIDNILSC